jgi:hypothetical protein
MSQIEVPFVNERTAERMYQRAKQKQEAGDYGFLERGQRAARARDPRLLRVLEVAAERADAMHERQRGQERRSATDNRRVEATEVQILRSAYTTLDKGTPEAAFGWIYAAATELAFGG